MRRGVVERRTTDYDLDSFAFVSKGLLNEDYCFLDGGSAMLNFLLYQCACLLFTKFPL
jgi:hypothetical protein